jgi:hypothetical protein
MSETRYGAIATVPGWIICLQKSNKILITFQIKYKKMECHFVQNKHICFCIEEKIEKNSENLDVGVI